MSTLRVNNLTNQANDGGIGFAVQPVIDGLAKAWVNFNGTGTVAIRASYNVSSITDNGVGDYTVNFTTAMVDANYSAVGNSSRFTQPGLPGAIRTTTQMQVQTQNLAGNQSDVDMLLLAIFR